jgi:hypothetical protein
MFAQELPAQHLQNTFYLFQTLAAKDMSNPHQTRPWHAHNLPPAAAICTIHAELTQLQVEKGLALTDIVREIHP